MQVLVEASPVRVPLSAESLEAIALRIDQRRFTDNNRSLSAHPTHPLSWVFP